MEKTPGDVDYQTQESPQEKIKCTFRKLLNEPRNAFSSCIRFLLPVKNFLQKVKDNEAFKIISKTLSVPLGLASFVISYLVLSSGYKILYEESIGYHTKYSIVSVILFAAAILLLFGVFLSLGLFFLFYVYGKADFYKAFWIKVLSFVFRLLKSLLVKLLAFTKRWVFEFKNKNTKGKILMLRFPIILLAGYLVFLFAKPYLEKPQIIVAYPENTSTEVPLDSTIEIQFTKPMMRSTVEKGIIVSLGIQGSFDWSGDLNVKFSPSQNFQRETGYVIDLSGARSRYFMPVTGEMRLSFTTLSQPKVVVASPRTLALQDSTPITVIFDRPMIPLTSVDNKENFVSPIKIEPSVEGEGRWLGTTAYQFRPDKPYDLSTTYTVTVSKGLASEDGGEVKEDYVWSFSSPRPNITMSDPPAGGYYYFNPYGEIKFYFDQPVNLATINKYFSLTQDGILDNSPMEGRFYRVIPGKTDKYGWPNPQADAFVAAFKPASPLQRKASYTATLDKGVEPLLGINGMEYQYSLNFQVVALPEAISSIPSDKSTDIKEEHQITVNFATPMDSDSFEDNVIISPKPEKAPSIYFSSNNDSRALYINTYLSRSSSYTVTITGNAKDIYGVSLGRSYTFSFQTAQYDPSVSVQPANTYFGSFYQGEVPRIVAKTTNTNTVKYKLFTLKDDQFIDLYRKRNDYNYECYGDCRNWQNYDLSQLKLVREWEETFDYDLNVPVNVITKVSDPNGGLLPSGIYFIDLSIPSNQAHDNMVMIISKSTLLAKSSENQVFTWAADQSSSNGVLGMKISVMLLDGRTVASGQTDSEGIWKQDLKSSDKPAFIFGTSNDDKIVSSLDWSSGINSYDFGIGYYYSYDRGENEDYRLFSLLDRPLYRPGQKVFFKGFIRKDNYGSYAKVDNGDRVSVSIIDTQGRTINTQSVVLNSFGTYSGEFVLSDDAQLGNYSVVSEYKGSKYNRYFQVEEYKRPDLQITSEPSKNNYYDGDKISVNVKASYYFGAPIANTPVKWTARRQGYYFTWDKDYRYTFSDNDDYGGWWSYGYYDGGYGELVKEGSVVTNDAGEAVIEFTPDIKDLVMSQRFVIEAYVTDVSNQYAFTTTDVVMHKGNYYLGVKPASYSNQAGKETSVDFVAVDQDGNTKPNVEAKVNVYKRTWKTVKEKNPDDGIYYYVTKYEDSLLISEKADTNDKGYGSLAFTPEDGGLYRIQVRSKDESDRLIRSSVYVWVYGENFSAPIQNHDRIDMITDKRNYLVDENVSVTLATPYTTKTKTLVTYERDKVFDYKFVDIDQNNNNGFSFKALDTYEPNIFVSAFLLKPYSGLKDPTSFKMAYAEVKVENPRNKIDLTVTTNKRVYYPHDKVKVTLQAKRSTGEPLKAEFSLGVVDKSLWDLSSMTFGNIYDYYYEPKGLQIRTSTPLTVSIDRINSNTNLGAKGGSGGGGGGDAGFETTRKEFPETAYWNGHIQTDNNGYAQVEFELPDNLTTWRIDSFGGSSEAAFGNATSEFISTKDVLVRPFMPRFLAVGDKSSIGGIFVNTTGSTIDAKVSISSDGLSIKGSAQKTVSLPAGSQKKVLWEADVGDISAANVDLSIQGANGLGDRVSLDMPVLFRYTPQTTAASGKVESISEENILIPVDAAKQLGGVDLTLSPSLGGKSLLSVGYFLDYPYWCMEQTTSRIIPSVSVIEVMRAANIDKLGDIQKNDLENMLNDSLQRVVKYQNGDGGWGWWNGDKSDDFITAYVYNGLLLAKEGGYTVSSGVLLKAENYLYNTVGGAKADASLKAYIVYLLAQSGLPQNTLRGIVSYLFETRYGMGIESRAYLAMAMSEMNPRDSRISRLKDEILGEVKKESTYSHWTNNVRSYSAFMGNNDTEATAVVLEMLARIDPQNPLIPETVRFFDIKSSEDANSYWGSTITNSIVLRSISLYMRYAGKVNIDESYKVELNNASMLNGKFGKDDLLKIVSYHLPMAGLSENAGNSLKFSKSGDGQLYYTADLTYYSSSKTIKEEDQGFTVIREIMDIDGKPVSLEKVKEGEEYWIRLIVVTPYSRQYVVLEDMLPAGFESQNESLKNVRTLDVTKPEITTYEDASGWYFYRKEYYDDKTTLFASYLPQGLFEVMYRVRATTPGMYVYPPARAYEMYSPDVFGHSSGGEIEVVAE